MGYVGYLHNIEYFILLQLTYSLAMTNGNAYFMASDYRLVRLSQSYVYKAGHSYLS